MENLAEKQSFESLTNIAITSCVDTEQTVSSLKFARRNRVANRQLTPKKQRSCRHDRNANAIQGTIAVATRVNIVVTGLTKRRRSATKK